MLENSGIAQQRINQSVSRSQDQRIQPALVSSTPYEISQVTMLLDDLLAEVLLDLSMTKTVSESISFGREVLEEL